MRLRLSANSVRYPNPISRGADKVCSLLEIPFLHRALVTPGCSERFERLTGHICQPRRFLSFALERFRSDDTTRLKHNSAKKIPKCWSDSQGTNVANAGFDYLAKAHVRSRRPTIPLDVH
jgi:hypothetical protein